LLRRRKAMLKIQEKSENEENILRKKRKVRRRLMKLLSRRLNDNLRYSLANSDHISWTGLIGFGSCMKLASMEF
jgi:hypothetical protein